MLRPLLNPELFNILYDSSVNKDKTTQRRQRLVVKATIPLLSALEELKTSKTSLETLAKPSKVLNADLFRRAQKKEGG